MWQALQLFYIKWGFLSRVFKPGRWVLSSSKRKKRLLLFLGPPPTLLQFESSSALSSTSQVAPQDLLLISPGLWSCLFVCFLFSSEEEVILSPGRPAPQKQWWEELGDFATMLKGPLPGELVWKWMCHLFQEAIGEKRRGIMINSHWNCPIKWTFSSRLNYEQRLVACQPCSLESN